jgi:hypothetical protein
VARPRQHRGGSEKPGERDRARLSAAHEPSDRSWTKRIFPSWNTTPRTSTFGVAYPASQANRSSTRIVSSPVGDHLGGDRSDRRVPLDVIRVLGEGQAGLGEGVQPACPIKPVRFHWMIPGHDVEGRYPSASERNRPLIPAEIPLTRQAGFLEINLNANLGGVLVSKLDWGRVPDSLFESAWGTSGSILLPDIGISRRLPDAEALWGCRWDGPMLTIMNTHRSTIWREARLRREEIADRSSG